MKNFIRIKSLRFKKPNTKAIRDEWSWSAIRRQFLYRSELWFGLPVVAALSFVVIYLVSMVGGFDGNHLHKGLAVAATSSFGYIVGMVTMASNAQKQKDEQEQDEEKQTRGQQVFAYVVFAAACLFLVANEIYEVVKDRAEIIESISAVLAIVAALMPALLAKLINR